MKKLLALATTLVLVSGCVAGVGPTPDPKTDLYPSKPDYIWHDDSRGVTCYGAHSGYGTNWSCVPDSQLKSHD